MVDVVAVQDGGRALEDSMRFPLGWASCCQWRTLPRELESSLPPHRAWGPRRARPPARRPCTTVTLVVVLQNGPEASVARAQPSVPAHGTGAVLGIHVHGHRECTDRPALGGPVERRPICARAHAQPLRLHPQATMHDENRGVCAQWQLLGTRHPRQPRPPRDWSVSAALADHAAHRALRRPRQADLEMDSERYLLRAVLLPRHLPWINGLLFLEAN
uniref:Uncharacterized protein n=1 Tax=Aegilops tauschii subsp. strangulata TaxID=200361 RepID=A0A453P3G0_AEGTS